MRPTRRLLLSSGLTLLMPARLLAQESPSPLLAAAQLRLGVERLAKLQLEQALLPQRAAAEMEKERTRLAQALRQLREAREQPRALQGLSSRRQAQLVLVAEEAADFVARPPRAVPQLVSDSEALAARLGFVTTALSGVEANAQRGAQIDLFARAGATALRIGKLNFAVLQEPGRQELRVGAAQVMQEFGATLEAVGQQTLSAQQAQALQLARHQGLLFRAGLGDDGLLRSRERLAELASTTDRIAESLALMARRA